MPVCLFHQDISYSFNQRAAFSFGALPERCDDANKTGVPLISDCTFSLHSARISIVVLLMLSSQKGFA